MELTDKPSMEGFLEKQSTGVSRLLGKNRFWCTLQGSCLVYCKDSKRSSVVESLMLGDAQMVRKTSNDRQGLQFEIVMKKQKTHVFSAASTEECGRWVRHLQQAMIHNDPGSRRSQLRRQVNSESGYEEIRIRSESNPSFGCQPPLSKQLSEPQSGIYSEVFDAVRPKSEAFPARKMSNPSAGEYAEVADAIRVAGDVKAKKPTDDTVDVTGVTKREVSSSSVDDNEEVVYRENSLYVINKQKENLQKLQNQREEWTDTGNGYSTLDSLDVTTRSEAETTTEQEGEREESEESHVDVPEYALVNKQRNPNTQATQPSTDTDDCTYVNIGHEVREGAAIEELDNELKRLPESSAAPVLISLTTDDWKPLEELKEFLADNRHLSRSSYVRQTCEGDPLVKVKELIQSIQ